MSFEVKKSLGQRLWDLLPFGLGHTKPHHFLSMAKVAWENRDNLPYAWKVLSRGVCDGCALGVAGFHDWTVEGVHLCMTRLNLLRLNTMPAMAPEALADLSKLQGWDNRRLRGLGRLAYPLRRRRGERGFTRISWDEAIQGIAARLCKVDPRRLAFFVTSRGVTNETYYVAQKVARFLGSNNVDNAARLCHSPSTAAMKASVGVAATTCSYSDFWKAQIIVFFGANPANDQPVSIKYLHEAKKQGAKVVLVNPYFEPGMRRYWVPSAVDSALFGTDVADSWFPVSQGGDIAFLYGTLKALFETGAQDERFIREHTQGFETLQAEARAKDWAVLERESGLSRAAMQEFAAMMAKAERGILVWSMGITQHTYGSDAVSMIINLALSRGFIGREGCGIMPIRGHSSVQAGAEMGAYATAFPGGKAVNAANAAELSARYGFTVPAEEGLSTVDMVEACAAGGLDLFYCLGGNFMSTLPDPDFVAGALAKVPLRVHQDIIVTDQMLLDGEEVILLPARTRYEQEGGGTETTTERRIIYSPEIPRQVGEARSEWRILLDLAAAAFPEKASLLGCQTADAIRAEIAQVVPFYAGVEGLAKTGDAVQYGGPLLCVDGVFPTEDGRARMHAPALPNLTRQPGEFELSTRRGKQFNSLIYAETDPLNGAGRDAVLMNETDASTLKLHQGQKVTLVNAQGRLACSVFLAPIAPGNLQVHFPEGNVLLARGLTDAGGGVPDYNARVRIEA